MVGDLSINGATQPIELDVEFFGTELFPMDQSTRGGEVPAGVPLVPTDGSARFAEHVAKVRTFPGSE